MLFSLLLAVASAPPVAPPAASAAPVPVQATGYTLATPIEVLVADPKAKAVLDADLPGLTTHKYYDSFKAMSLTELQPLSEGRITDAALKKVAADLAVLH